MRRLTIRHRARAQRAHRRSTTGPHTRSTTTSLLARANERARARWRETRQRRADDGPIYLTFTSGSAPDDAAESATTCVKAHVHANETGAGDACMCGYEEYVTVRHTGKQANEDGSAKT